MEVIEKSVTHGEVLLLENIMENVDPVLEPLLGRNTIKMGDKELENCSTFKLILHTKLANPHYKPEMQVRMVRY